MDATALAQNTNRLLNGLRQSCARPTLSDQPPEGDENPDLDQASNACDCRRKEHITQRHGSRPRLARLPKTVVPRRERLRTAGPPTLTEPVDLPSDARW